MILAVGLLSEQRELVSQLEHLPVYYPIGFFFAGILILIYGWKAHRWVIASNCCALGLILGAILGGHAQIAVIGAIVGGVVAAILSFPMMKWAGAGCAGIIGAIVGNWAWIYFAQPSGLWWAGALIGFIFLSLLTFVLFKTSVILTTCLEGAILLIISLTAMLISWSPWGGDVRLGLTFKPLLLPVLIFFVAFLGIVYQQHQHGLLDSGGSGSAGGSASKSKPAKK